MNDIIAIAVLLSLYFVSVLACSEPALDFFITVLGVEREKLRKYKWVIILTSPLTFPIMFFVALLYIGCYFGFKKLYKWYKRICKEYL